MRSIDISSLSREERLELLEKLWDSFESEPEALPLSDEHRAELDRRIDEMDQNPEAGTPVGDVVARLRNRP